MKSSYTALRTSAHAILPPVTCAPPLPAPSGCRAWPLAVGRSYRAHSPCSTPGRPIRGKAGHFPYSYESKACQCCPGRIPKQQMTIDAAQVILDSRCWIAETADGSGRSSLVRTSFVRGRENDRRCTHCQTGAVEANPPSQRTRRCSERQAAASREPMANTGLT